jgi:hypothetical protein
MISKGTEVVKGNISLMEQAVTKSFCIRSSVRNEVEMFLRLSTDKQIVAFIERKINQFFEYWCYCSMYLIITKAQVFYLIYYELSVLEFLFMELQAPMFESTWKKLSVTREFIQFKAKTFKHLAEMVFMAVFQRKQEFIV